MSRLCSSPAPLDDEDLLEEILLRLPPNASSLPRASLVCKRWRNILSNPQLLRRFHKHHRKPPLLGFFTGPVGATQVFRTVLDSPNHISSTRFTLPHKGSISDYDYCHLMCCRHGLAILVHPSQREIIVWDPLTCQKKCVPFPPSLSSYKRDTFLFWHAAVMCADSEAGHVHGDCFTSLLKLVLIWVAVNIAQAFSCLYESATGVWGDIVLVGNAICWLLRKGDILAFDVERRSFGVIEKPADALISKYRSVQLLLRLENCVLGLAILSELTIKLWERKSDYDGVVGWVLLQKIIRLEVLFPLGIQSDYKRIMIMGYDEDTNVIVLSTAIGNFIL